MHTTTEDTQNPKSTSRLRRRCRLPLVATTAVACAAAALTACGSKTDANEKNFSAALNQYFEKKGELCLDISDGWPVIKKGWPIDITESALKNSSSPYGIASQMAALEAAGLVTSEDSEANRTDFRGRPTNEKYKIRHFTLTEAAKPFMRDRGNDNHNDRKQIDLCWGKKALGEIVKWEGPLNLGPYQDAYLVTYTYKINDVADWAKKPDVQAAFLDVKRAFDAVGKEDKHAVKLTSEGWEALGLDR